MIRGITCLLASMFGKTRPVPTHDIQTFKLSPLNYMTWSKEGVGVHMGVVLGEGGSPSLSSRAMAAYL